MKTLSLKTKIAFIIMVVLLAVGIAFIGIFGLNNSARDKNGFELSVKAEANIGNVSSVLKETTEDYLESKGASAAATVVYDGGGQYVFAFGKDYKDVIDTAELADKIKTAFSADEILAGLDVTVKYNETVNVNYAQSALYITFAIIICAAVIFAYTAIAEKSIAAALGVFCPSVVSALLFFAVAGLIRVPAGEFFAAAVAFSAALSAVFSLVLVNRFAEEIRLLPEGKPDYEKIADTGANKGLFRIILSASIVAVLGLLIFVFGIAGDMKWAGLQTVICAACAAFSTLTFTAFIWKIIKSSGKGEKNLPKKEQVQEN